MRIRRFVGFLMLSLIATAIGYSVALLINDELKRKKILRQLADFRSDFDIVQEFGLRTGMTLQEMFPDLGDNGKPRK